MVVLFWSIKREHGNVDMNMKDEGVPRRLASLRVPWPSS